MRGSSVLQTKMSMTMPPALYCHRHLIFLAAAASLLAAETLTFPHQRELVAQDRARVALALYAESDQDEAPRSSMFLAGRVDRAFQLGPSFLGLAPLVGWTEPSCFS